MYHPGYSCCVYSVKCCISSKKDNLFIIFLCIMHINIHDQCLVCLHQFTIICLQMVYKIICENDIPLDIYLVIDNQFVNEFKCHLKVFSFTTNIKIYCVWYNGEVCI